MSIISLLSLSIYVFMLQSSFMVIIDCSVAAKASKKFQPKAKSKPKPKTQPESEFIPAPSKHSVEAAATVDNEPIGRTGEEQHENVVNQISGNIHDGQSSLKKSQDKVCKLYV